MQEFLVVDLVKGLREIQKDGVGLFFAVEAEAKVSDCGEELSFAAAFLSEPMLELVQGGVFLKMIHDVAVYYVF